jgi:hypothetical protein
MRRDTAYGMDDYYRDPLEAGPEDNPADDLDMEEEDWDELDPYPGDDPDDDGPDENCLPGVPL